MRILPTTFLCLAVSSCVMSDLDPDADVEVHGIVRAPDGAPLARQRIALVKTPDLGEVLVGIVGGPATVLACLGDEPPAICQDAMVDQTGEQGQYSFYLKGHDTQGSAGTASYFNLATHMQASAGQIEGPSLSQRFLIQDELLTLPQSRLWDPSISIVSDVGSMQVSVAPTDGRTFSLRFQADSSIYGRAIWEVPDYDGSSVDMRLLEDNDAGILAASYANLALGSETLELHHRSGTYAQSALAGAPPSRGASCFVRDVDGGVHELVPCVLTDGDLFSTLSRVEADCEQTACEGAKFRSAYLDLGSQRAIDLIVARVGYSDEVQVETSTDALAWTPLKDPQTGWFAMDAVDTMARYVRITGVSGSIHLTELSVW